MPPRPKILPPEDTPQARRRRMQVWATLLSICRSLERMQVSPEARAACRAVAAQLAQLREHERNSD